MRRLQVALDLLDLDKALKIALEVADYVDHIEAGTPLIKKYGMKAVETLKEETGKTVVADMKIMDTGALEAELAFQHGADYVTVLAAAHQKTIEDVIDTANRYSRGSMVDTIAVEDPNTLFRKLDRLARKPDYLLIHSGIDMQNMGITPERLIKAAGDRVKEYRIGVAGGIKLENIEVILGIEEIELIIVGGGLTKALNPRETAKKLREVIKMY